MARYVQSNVPRKMDRADAIVQSIFHSIGSIDFPASFPVDFMHLMLENVMKQLLQLWDGTFKAQSQMKDARAKETPPYVVPAKKGWDEVDLAVLGSAKLIPWKMSGTLTSVSSRWRWTADNHLFFLLTLGPIVLKSYLPPRYFDHFLDLSEMTKILVGVQVDRESQLPFIRNGLHRWVMQFDE